MNWLIAILGFIVLTIIALFVQKKIIQERRDHRVRFKVVVHMVDGKPIVWYTSLPWSEVQKHLPPCTSRMGDDRVFAWEIAPP